MLHSWAVLLTFQNLEHWTHPYPLPDHSPVRNILVITAGNIPLVGFHDFLTVLISGNRFIGRLSSRDSMLLKILAEELIRIEPEFADRIYFRDSVVSFDAAIATGSDNSARYFNQEYGQIPHLIRKNRSSAAVLDGTETKEEISRLTADLLEYYGLGCRSISHLFLPAGYNPAPLVKEIIENATVDPCEPLNDNLRFQKARLTLLNIPFIDAGKLLLVENENLHSPIGVVHYNDYRDSTKLFDHLTERKNEIQCLVGHQNQNPALIPFGTAQKPELWDYADDTDTLAFLIAIS